MSPPSSPWIMNLSIMLLLTTGKMVLILMLLLRNFGGRLGNVCSLTFGHLTLLHFPILPSYCQGVVVLISRGSSKVITNEFGRWRELAFPPLVFSATGVMGPVATTIYRKLAFMLVGKWKMNYSLCLFWVRCCLRDSLLSDVLEGS